MEISVFDFDSYKRYLAAVISSKPKRGRGVKSALAQALNCQTSYISQVLGGDAELSLEQGEQLKGFLGHSLEESTFFLLLIQQARAGTPSLRRHWEHQISLILEKRLVLKERFDIKRELTREDQAIYYSSWLYSAVHILLMVPQFRSREAIAVRLGITIESVSRILEFLRRIGLAKMSGGALVPGDSQLFLGADSPLISKHHINWRLQAIRSVEREDAGEDFHYSGAWSISERDFVAIKAQLVKYLDQTRTTLKASKEEEVVCLNLDFFRI